MADRGTGRQFEEMDVDSARDLVRWRDRFSLIVIRLGWLSVAPAAGLAFTTNGSTRYVLWGAAIAEFGVLAVVLLIFAPPLRQAAKRVLDHGGPLPSTGTTAPTDGGPRAVR